MRKNSPKKRILKINKFKSRRSCIKSVKKKINLVLFFFVLLPFTFAFNFQTYDFPPEKNDTIYDTVVIYDTAYVYDTVYVKEVIRDTVRIFESDISKKNDSFNIVKSIQDNRNILKKLKERTHSFNKLKFGLDFNFSPFYGIQKITSNNVYYDAVNINLSTLSPSIGYSVGSSLSFNKSLIQSSVGFAFTEIKQDFSFLSTGLKIDTVNYYKYFAVSEINIDSIAFINIDTLMATGDTIYEYYIDTTYIQSMDSVLSQKQDSVEFQFKDNCINKIRYYEIPVIFSLPFYFKSTLLKPEIGIIVGIFMFSEGKVVSLENLKVSNDINSEIAFSKLALSLYGGIRLESYLNRRISLFFRIFYRRNLSPVAGNYPLTIKYNIYGLQLGLMYRFNFIKNK